MVVKIIHIAIIDADLIGRKKHRFPNLACMKISGYLKSKNHEVELITDYAQLCANYNKIYISKAFTDTIVPERILSLPNVEIGGTGFFYDKADPLPHYIEHHMPDYYLYDRWVNEQIRRGCKPLDFRYYTDYSIGFMTRGCFRKCEFCVNKNYNQVLLHSPIEEFLDEQRKYICLLDDNVLGYRKWENIFKSVQATNKRFEFKQGMDMRLMTEKKARVLTESKYIGDYIFAFDNIEDKDIIERKLMLWRKYCSKTTKLFIFTGYDRQGKWDNDFWVKDIADTFERLKMLMKFGCLPYLMRFDRYLESPYKGTYINLSRWCNQPNIFKKMSYRQFCVANGLESSTNRYLMQLENDYPDVAKEYFDIKFEYLGLHY